MACTKYQWLVYCCVTWLCVHEHIGNADMITCLHVVMHMIKADSRQHQPRQQAPKRPQCSIRVAVSYSSSRSKLRCSIISPVSGGSSVWLSCSLSKVARETTLGTQSTTRPCQSLWRTQSPEVGTWSLLVEMTESRQPQASYRSLQQ